MMIKILVTLIGRTLLSYIFDQMNFEPFVTHLNPCTLFFIEYSLTILLNSSSLSLKHKSLRDIEHWVESLDLPVKSSQNFRLDSLLVLSISYQDIQ